MINLLKVLIKYFCELNYNFRSFPRFAGCISDVEGGTHASKTKTNSLIFSVCFVLLELIVLHVN